MRTLKFDELNLSKDLLRAIADMGFEEATPIQSQAIPSALKGSDLIGQAQTGTGKTASFAIPMIEAIDAHLKKVQALVLCPTRELAIQVSEEAGELLKYKKGIRTIPVYGGQAIDRQIRALQSGVQIVIGTPGRVIDHIERGTLKLNDIKIVILDEADEMLDMGFRDDIERILSKLPEERQTLMFSATMPKPILDLSRKYLKHPEHIKVVHKEVTVPNVNQYYIELKPAMKLEVLTRLIDIHNPKLSLIFCNRKRSVDDLVTHLQARGFSAEGLHGDMKQQMRDRVMAKFRSGKLEVLVATDVAARGIDVDDIDAVFNYDLPQDDEYYVHRIGRTARAGRAGQAFTFVVGKEFRAIREIEKYTKTRIVRMQIPTIRDVEAVRVNTLVSEIKEVLADESSVNKYSYIIESLMNEDHSSVEIASALLKMIIRNGEAADKIDEDFRERSYEHNDRSSGKKKRGKDSKRERSRGDRDSRSNTGDTERLFINIGKKSKVMPKDILGAIAGESGVPGSAVGSIDIYDGYSFVDVQKKYAKKIINVMDGNQIKGKKIAVQIANDR